MCSPTEKSSRRLLKKATFSPAQPLCAKTRLVPVKAAASEGQAYPLGYVEGLNDARTKLADFFSSLLELRNRIDHQLKPGRDGFLPVPLFVLAVPHGKRHGLHPARNKLGFVLLLFTHQ